jgi:hypothetical protein
MIACLYYSMAALPTEGDLRYNKRHQNRNQKRSSLPLHPAMLAMEEGLDG